MAFLVDNGLINTDEGRNRVHGGKCIKTVVFQTAIFDQIIIK